MSRKSGMTGIIAAKADARDGRLLPEYELLQVMSDCVVALRHRFVAGTAIRVLRVGARLGRRRP